MLNIKILTPVFISMFLFLFFLFSETYSLLSINIDINEGKIKKKIVIFNTLHTLYEISIIFAK